MGINSVIAVGAVLAAFTIGLAGGNMVPGSGAGDGAMPITGYRVSNIAYNLEPMDPQYLRSVEFDLDAPAGEVKLRLTSSTPMWYTCNESPSGSGHWVCATNVQVLTVDEFRVIAVR